MSLNTNTNLIIFDNIQSNEELKFLKDFIPNFKVLITTRVDFNKIKSLSLGALTYEDSKKLFFEYHKTNENIDNILKYLDYHTLFIELTAKSLTYSSILTVSSLEKKFQAGNFKTVYYNHENLSFHDYLNELFEINGLKNDESFLLRQLALFPSTEISFNELINLLDIKEDNFDNFDNRLHNLVKMGWLIKKNKKFKLHQIIKEFLFANYKLNINEAQNIVINMSNLLKIENFYKLNHNDKTYSYLPYCQSVSKYFGLVSVELIDLGSKIAVLLDEIGNFNDSLKYYKDILEKLKEFDINDELILFQYYNNLSITYMYKEKNDNALESAFLAIEALKKLEQNKVTSEYGKIYNNLALIYINIFKYKDAYSEIKKSIVFKEISNDNKIELSIAYTNLALICNNLFKETKKNEYLDEGFLFQKKAIEIQLKVIPNSKPLSASYTNLSLLYQSKFNQNKALEYQLMSLNILEHYYKFMTYEIAKSYCNLALIYNDIKEMDIALYFHKIALEKRLDCLDYPHSEIALSYNELSHVYKNLKKYDEAISSQIKSQEIYKLIFGENYYDIYDSYFFLALAYSEKENSLKKVMFYFDKAIASFKISKLFRLDLLLLIEFKEAQYFYKINEKKELKKILISIEKTLLEVNNYPLELFLEFNQMKKSIL